MAGKMKLFEHPDFDQFVIQTRELLPLPSRTEQLLEALECLHDGQAGLTEEEAQKRPVWPSPTSEPTITAMNIRDKQIKKP